MNTSPLGQYAPVVASLAAIAIVGGAILAALTNNAAAQSALHDPLFLALGAIFGSAAAVPAISGHVAAEVAASSKRLDAIHAPPAAAITGENDRA